VRYEDSLNTVLQQECLRYNKLLGEMISKLLGEMISVGFRV